MRLMRKVPEVRAKLESNSISLTATSKLATFVRREKCGEARTLDLLEKITEKPTREVERLLAAEQTIADAKPDFRRSSGPGITRIAFDADPEFLALFETLRDIQGRPNWSMNDRLKAALRIAIAAKTPKIKAAANSENQSEAEFESNSESKSESKSDPALDPKLDPKAVPKLDPASRYFSKPAGAQKPTRYIPVSVRAVTYQRSAGRCEFVDARTGRRCESRFGLHLDHVHPFAKGGDSSAANIRHLCASHNQFAAIREFGAAKCGAAEIGAH